MALDAPYGSAFAGGEVHEPPPFSIEGLFPLPPTQTISTQATGTGATLLRVGLSEGRVRLPEFSHDFTAQEVTVYTNAAQLTDFASGYAVWCTAVAVQHRPAGSISIVHVIGTVAVVASVVKPTLAEIKTAIDGSNQTSYMILGDTLFYRSADLVVDHRVDYERRPAYVDEANKSGAYASQDDQAAMGLEYWGAIDFYLDLTQAFAQTAGDQILKTEAPALPFGGLCGQLEYAPAKDAAGAGGDISLRPNVDNPGAAAAVAADGDDLQLLVAGAVVGTTTSNTRAPGSYTTDPYFKPGATISIELQAKPTAFTDGFGILKLHIWKCVPFG